jgi:transcription antitermination factor NusG
MPSSFSQPWRNSSDRPPDSTASPTVTFQAGQEVKITQGALAGFSGIVVRAVEKGRWLVQLSDFRGAYLKIDGICLRASSREPPA